MKSLLLLSICFSCFFSSSGQNRLEDIKSEYKLGKYPEVISMGEKYRNTLKGKGIPVLDYMILTSYCMNPAKKEAACTVSNIILDDYYKGLDATELSTMKNGFASICNQNELPNNNILAKLTNVHYAHDKRYSGIFSDFKSYAVIQAGFVTQSEFKEMSDSVIEGVSDLKSVSNDTTNAIEDEEIEKLTNRRCKKNNYDLIKQATMRFSKDSRYYTSPDFVIIANTNNPINLKTVSDHIEKVLQFYIDFYGFDRPSDLITVYLSDKFENVKSNVNRLYGIQMNFNICGYSNQFDNSITSWITNSDGVGSIKHELFHLLVKTKFNNIPHWFEEGLAELYEESQFDNNILTGKNNWRLPLVKSNLFNYSLSDLINNTGFAPTPQEKELMRTKIINYILKWNTEIYRQLSPEVDKTLNTFINNYFYLYQDALSRYFLLYLQETGKLKPLYDNLLKRDINIFDIENYVNTENLVLTSCNKIDMKELEIDFRAWLNAQK